jgi:hypothetical protein
MTNKEWWNDGVLEYWVDERAGIVQGPHLSFVFYPIIP